MAARTEARPAVGHALLLPWETLPIDIDEEEEEDGVSAASTASLEASYALPPRRCWTALAAARLAYTVEPGMEPDPTPAQLPYLEGGGATLTKTLAAAFRCGVSIEHVESGRRGGERDVCR